MEKAHSVREVDVRSAESGVWLVKVPKYLADKWENSSTRNVGKLRIAPPKAPGGKTDVIFSLDDHLLVNDSGQRDVPKEHQFVISGTGLSASHALTVLSKEVAYPDPEPGVVQEPVEKLSLEGRIIKRAECRPIVDKSYMAMKKQHMKSTTEPRRKVEILGRVELKYKPRARHVHEMEADRDKKDNRKLRMDKAEVMELLFSAFEKHQYYNVKDLVRITQQPITYLKEILKELCHYNMKAPHKNMWELKEEYRHYKEDKD